MTATNKYVSTPAESRDAIVIGGNLAGLSVSYLLTCYGYSVTTIEKAPFIGGIDGSFKNRNGRIFDFGVHALDYMRSEFATRLMLQAVDGDVNRMERKRAIVHRDTLIPYNSDKSEWPEEMVKMLPDGELVDLLGTQIPTRENLSKFYGKEFTDFIFDETLASYPSETRHLDFGIEEWNLMVNIYPWYFPRARRSPAEINASRIYHDHAREVHNEELVYPRKEGFSAFAKGFARKVEERGGEVIVGAGDLHVEYDSAVGEVTHIDADGRRFQAERIFWCAPPESLANLLSIPFPDLKTDIFVLGSFEFDQPVQCGYTELIVGDPQHLIDRASFPGKFSLEKDNLVQLEFAYPRQSDQHESNEEYWRDKWVASLQKLGIVSPDNPVIEFDLKSIPMLYNTVGVDGKLVPEIDFSKTLPETSNLLPVLPSIQKININTRLPMYLKYLAEELQGNRHVKGKLP